MIYIRLVKDYTHECYLFIKSTLIQIFNQPKLILLLNSGPESSLPRPIGGAGDTLYAPKRLDSLL
jgi:hypothetical protein